LEGGGAAWVRGFLRTQPSLEDVFEFLPSAPKENPQSGWVTMCLDRKGESKKHFSKRPQT
jgi:hypothetical protein